MNDSIDAGSAVPAGSPLPSLTEIAARGELARAARELPAEAVAELRREAFALVWPLIYHHHTRALELRRGHLLCAQALRGMDPACYDRFSDNVIWVIDYLFAYAKSPIANLPGWIRSRTDAAIIDGYRRRRGELGAQQRPRVPKWLAAELADEWLVQLAERILDWVGRTSSAGTRWPLDSWAQARAAVTGDWRHAADPHRVLADVGLVCGAMDRMRPAWYARYVEQPLDRRCALAIDLCAEFDLAAVPAASDDEGLMVELAALALDSIVDQTAAGADPAVVVPAVLDRVFLRDHAASVPASRPWHTDSIIDAVIEIVCSAPGGAGA